MKKTFRRIGIGLVLGLALILTLVLTALPALAKPQETCPVMNNPVNKQVYTDYPGKRVYFCCPACIETFEKEPDKYLKVLEEAGEEPEDAPKE